MRKCLEQVATRRVLKALLIDFWLGLEGRKVQKKLVFYKCFTTFCGGMEPTRTGSGLRSGWTAKAIDRTNHMIRPYLSGYLYIYTYIHIGIYIYIYLYIRIYVFIVSYVSLSLSISISIYLYIYLYIPTAYGP